MTARRLNRLSVLALLLLFTYSLPALILDSIDCTVGALFYLWTALLCLCAWLSTSTRRGVWFGTPLSLLLLFAAYRTGGYDILEQVNAVFDHITGAYLSSLSAAGQKYTSPSGTADISLIAVFLAFLFSYYMSAAITSHRGRLFLSLLGSLPFFFACLAVNVRPDIAPVLGLILFWFLVAAGGGGYDEDAGGARAVFGSALPLLLLFAVLLLIVRPDRYEPEPPRLDLRSAIHRSIESVNRWIGERLSEDLFPESSYVPDTGTPQEDPEREDTADAATLTTARSRIGALDLTQGYDSADLERVFLTVRSDRGGTLYLRTVSYGDYTGTGWLPAEEYPGGSSLAFTAQAVSSSDSIVGTITVRSASGLSAMAVPYYCVVDNAADAYVPSDGGSEYVLRYATPLQSGDSLALPAGFREAEAQYRLFAHDIYTRLPDGSRSVLLRYAAEKGLDPGSADLIERTARTVQSAGEYDLETAPYASGDYAVCFLTEQQRGYCIHFATAAAALYRALGVPARVTEGYLVSVEAGEETDVLGRDAHAWVEIYRDGLGWLPVEVTGQSGLRPDSGAEAEAERETGLADGEAAPAEPRDTGEPAVPETPPSAEASPLPVGIVERPSPAENASAASGIGTWVLRILSLLLLLLIVPVRRALLLILRRRRIAGPDTHQACITLYRLACRMTRFGAEMPPCIRHSAEKAAFSARPVSGEEIAACRDALKEMTEKTYQALPLPKRLLFKYWHAFL